MAKIAAQSARQIYLETIDNGTEFPEYGVLAYTTGTPKNIPPEDKKITSLQAADFIKRFENGTYNKEPILDSKNQTCKFVYPVTLSRPQGKRLVGFSIVTYKQEVFMYPYFQIKVCVFTVVIIFIYFSILLTLFISDYIVNPLLFLRVNVRKASDSLSEMMSGSTKISPQNLIYNDVIKTRDEIKDLSLEIGNMVTVIRGITPYISASTLRNAEKDSRKSTGKELCFLFTDIRGFTSLCETLPPKEVVSILNHYLDLETEIILNNGGDVDKFVGDEMMAFFSGAKKEYNACKAAMEIRKVMAEEQKKSIARGLPVISIGIGINTGKVVFGPVGLDVGVPQHGFDARSGHGVEQHQPVVGEYAVLAYHRNNVGSNAQGGQVQERVNVPAQIEMVLQAIGPGKLEPDPASGKVFARIGAIFPFRVEDCIGGRNLPFGQMVVAYNDVDAVLLRVEDFRICLDAAVQDNHQAHFVLDGIVDAPFREAVPVDIPVGDKKAQIVRVGHELFQEKVDQGYGRNPIHIVIAVDADAFFVFEGPLQPLHRPVHVFHEEGVVKMFEPRLEKPFRCFFGGYAALV